MPPYQATIEPPLNAFERFVSSIPSMTATRASSSLSSSPREGTARFTNAAAAIIPAQKPSLNKSSERKTRMPLSLSKGQRGSGAGVA